MIEPLSASELELEYNPGRVYQPGDRTRVAGVCYVARIRSMDADPRRYPDAWRRVAAPARTASNPNVEE